MSVWDIYRDRITAHGATKREAQLKRGQRMLCNKLLDNLSYQELMIDGAVQEMAVVNSDNLNEKYIYSMPGEDIAHGGLVVWEDSYWIVTDYDAHNEVYTRAKMAQCNHLLKWVSPDGVIHEQWCIVEDGTKYLTGELEDRNFVVTRGDTRIAVTIARNAFTSKLDRNSRFLIDDPGSPLKLAYQLTKPFKLSGVYNNKGVYKFVLQEVVTTDEDNQDLGIADYYKYFPKQETSDTEDAFSDADNNVNERKVWL